MIQIGIKINFLQNITLQSIIGRSQSLKDCNLPMIDHHVIFCKELNTLYNHHNFIIDVI